MPISEIADNCKDKQKQDQKNEKFEEYSPAALLCFSMGNYSVHLCLRLLNIFKLFLVFSLVQVSDELLT